MDMYRKTLPHDIAAIARRSFLATVLAAPALLLASSCRGAATTIAQADRQAGALYVADFRRRGLSDRQVLANAFQAWVEHGGTLHLEPNRRYNLGIQATTDHVFQLFWMQDATLAGNGATLVIQTRGEVTYNLFYLAHYRNLRIENLSAVDTGFRDTSDTGAKFIVVDAGQRDSVDITLDNVAGERLVSFIQLQGRPGGPRVRGVRIMPNCRATRVFYGLACLNQGDDVSGGFSTHNSGRSYFPYGVRNHSLDIRVHHQGAGYGPAAETAILIKCYGPTTSRIRLHAEFSGTLASGGSCVTLEHQHDPAGSPSIIEDIDLRITIAPGTTDPNNSHRVALRTLTPADREETGRTRNIWRRIRIAGILRPGRAPAIFSHANPVAPAEIMIAPGTSGAEPDRIAAPGFRFRRG
ncbi:hypothetical protein RCO27_13405 [Sphingosinicella sp. LHD-64]|uniref:hypothetical protein n=1 Tax=Sphingosinicella sp. LHD-64 TaxID=3072139 RepID=UPI00280F4506|nr:hypothetical protein [Sphingosinicella sp. LHD-64]MDQ8757223.1 hypothetical protein [Sphingosinicella sp. LHD-64]